MKKNKSLIVKVYELVAKLLLGTAVISWLVWLVIKGIQAIIRTI